MTAIITDLLRQQILNSVFTDIDSSANNYYIGLGKSEVWDSADTAPSPQASLRDERQARNSLQSVKLVTNKSLVIPRNNWSIGTVYNGYNDDTPGHPNPGYFVYTDANNVYLCLQQGRNVAGAAVTSTVKPTSTADQAFKLSDGYVWKYMYNVGALSSSKFVASNFIPVTKIDSADTNNNTTSEVDQKRIQDAATAGEIVGYNILAGGSGYTSTPTVTVTGNGTAARATATTSGGAISKIEMKDSGGTLATGSNYTFADVLITGGGGSGAIARPIFGPAAGFGADPTVDLRAKALMFNVKPSGDENTDFIIGNDFRQVVVMKNPKKNQAADSDFIADTGIVLNRLKFASVGVAFTADNVILGASSGAKAVIDKKDADEIWYHQNEDTGFGLFTEGEAVNETGGGNGSGTLDASGVDGDSLAYIAGEVDQHSGQMLYIDNRAAVTRSAEQTEDIKIVIQL